ncbi:hypothetical protein LDENG_00292480 [Lucifuga dentata]|nr:hypothetical protein LDENG_00292480 [Lucifuga dentata]
MFWIVVLLQNEILINNSETRWNHMSFKDGMVILFLHNSFNLDQVSRSLSPPKHPCSITVYIAIA